MILQRGVQVPVPLVLRRGPPLELLDSCDVGTDDVLQQLPMMRQLWQLWQEKPTAVFDVFVQIIHVG
jgi:hypothetical protein